MKPEPETSADDSQNIEAGGIFDLLEMDSESLSQHLHEVNHDSVPMKRLPPLNVAPNGTESQESTSESGKSAAMSTRPGKEALPLAGGGTSSLADSLTQWTVGQIENMKSLTSSKSKRGKKGKGPRRYEGLTEEEKEAIRIKTNKMEKNRMDRLNGALRKLESALPARLTKNYQRMTQSNIYKTTSAYICLLSVCKAFNASMDGNAFQYGLQLIADCQSSGWKSNLIDTSVFNHLFVKVEGCFFQVLKKGILHYNACDLTAASAVKHAYPLVRAFQTESASSARWNVQLNNSMTAQPIKILPKPLGHHEQCKVPNKRPRKATSSSPTPTFNTPKRVRRNTGKQTNEDVIPSATSTLDTVAQTMPWLQHVIDTKGRLSSSSLAPHSLLQPEQTFSQSVTFQRSMIHAYHQLQLAAVSHLRESLQATSQPLTPSSPPSVTDKQEEPSRIPCSRNLTQNVVTARPKITPNAPEDQRINSAKNVDQPCDSSLTLQECDTNNNDQPASCPSPITSTSAAPETDFEFAIPVSRAPGHSSPANKSKPHKNRDSGDGLAPSSSVKRKTRKPVKLWVVNACDISSGSITLPQEMSALAFKHAHSPTLPHDGSVKNSTDSISPVPATTHVQLLQGRYPASNVSVVKPNVRRAKNLPSDSDLGSDLEPVRCHHSSPANILS